MPRYADVDKLMEHAISMDWSSLKWVNEVDIYTAINPNVVERKKGQWLAKSFHEVYCDKCGFDFDIMKNEFIDKMKYCPNCGADMRKGGAK